MQAEQMSRERHVERSAKKEKEKMTKAGDDEFNKPCPRRIKVL